MGNSLGPLGAAVEGNMFPRPEGDVVRVLEALVEGGARVGGSGALQVAAKRGMGEAVRVLVERGADVGERVGRVEGGRTALELAEAGGHGEVVGFLRGCGGE